MNLNKKISVIGMVLYFISVTSIGFGQSILKLTSYEIGYMEFAGIYLKVEGSGEMNSFSVYYNHDPEMFKMIYEFVKEIKESRNAWVKADQHSDSSRYIGYYGAFQSANNSSSYTWKNRYHDIHFTYENLFSDFWEVTSFGKTDPVERTFNVQNRHAQSYEAGNMSQPQGYDHPATSLSASGNQSKNVYMKIRKDQSGIGLEVNLENEPPVLFTKRESSLLFSYVYAEMLNVFALKKSMERLMLSGKSYSHNYNSSYINTYNWTDGAGCDENNQNCTTDPELIEDWYHIEESTTSEIHAYPSPDENPFPKIDIFDDGTRKGIRRYADDIYRVVAANAGP